MGVNEERPRSKAELRVHSIVWGKREICIEAGRSSQRCRERREGNGRETDDSGEHNGNHAFRSRGPILSKASRKPVVGSLQTLIIGAATWWGSVGGLQAPS